MDGRTRIAHAKADLKLLGRADAFVQQLVSECAEGAIRDWVDDQCRSHDQPHTGSMVGHPASRSRCMVDGCMTATSQFDVARDPV
jgi:hypothetical protein